MKVIDLNKKAWQWFILILLSLIWGSSFILMKRGLESYSGMQVGTMRIFFTFIFLLPFAFKRFKKIKRSHIKSLLIVGFIGNFFPALLFATAQTEISSSLAGMLNSSFPLFALLVGSLMYKTKTDKSKLLGIFIGLIGAVGLVVGKEGSSYNGNIWFAALVLIANMFYAISLNEIKYKLADLDGITVTIFAFVFTGPVAGTYLLFSDYSEALTSPGYIENLGYIALLALLSSAVAVTLFYTLLNFTDAVFAASVTYIIPIFAMLWGLFDSEIITIVQVLFMLVILFGVYLVNKNGKNNSSQFQTSKKISSLKP